MIKSMTAFGRARYESESKNIRVLRSFIIGVSVCVCVDVGEGGVVKSCINPGNLLSRCTFFSIIKYLSFLIHR